MDPSIKIRIMKEKAYDPARHNEKAPERGMAAVNTHNEEEEQDADTTANKIPNKEVDQDVEQKDAEDSSVK
jgi:hypothetical protein